MSLDTTPLLQIEQAKAGYAGSVVLHGINLDINASEVVALIGPNGHGKTTLLRLLSGLIPLISGKITFAGKPIEATDTSERVRAGLVHVPQGDQLFPEMSVEENLLMGAYLCDDPAETHNRLEEVYTLFPKLKDRRTQYCNGLSGGERRMVGIGRGLMANGRLIMLDEPSLGLAPLIIEQIYQALNELTKSGRTFLVVEENPVRISEIAQKISLVQGGKVHWSGTREALQSSPELSQVYFGGH
ncbi:ABC transporter ATP-binding protein [uncultured Roseovarius sp.]|uniref:ABC transporter ATP-binding protein n=1 Tax=uncultured Roseovarius sp. TaxID=293344 RepID=UPI00260CC765|nr:ABC transporter ATP-binding protein [uncultured Roseovarius sp.]